MKNSLAFFFAWIVPFAAAERYDLNGTISLHDGPNCYNGAFSWLNYVSEIRQTGNVEARYYLENFCAEVPRSNTANDLMVLLWENKSLEHAAVIISSGVIFEKGSIAGKLGRFEDAERDSVYKIRPIFDSPYFGANNDGSFIHQYRCASSESLQRSLDNLDIASARKVFAELFNSLEKMTFETKISFEKYEGFLEAIKSITGIISGLSGREESAIYQLALADSVNSHLGNLEMEHNGIFGSPNEYKTKTIQKVPRAWSDARQNLWAAMKTLRLKILKYNSDDKTKKIMDEMGPYG